MRDTNVRVVWVHVLYTGTVTVGYRLAQARIIHTSTSNLKFLRLSGAMGRWKTRAAWERKPTGSVNGK
jgi:hypothetical protein